MAVMDTIEVTTVLAPSRSLVAVAGGEALISMAYGRAIRRIASPEGMKAVAPSRAMTLTAWVGVTYVIASTRLMHVVAEVP